MVCPPLGTDVCKPAQTVHVRGEHGPFRRWHEQLSTTPVVFRSVLQVYRAGLASRPEAGGPQLTLSRAGTLARHVGATNGNELRPAPLRAVVISERVRRCVGSAWQIMRAAVAEPTGDIAPRGAPALQHETSRASGRGAGRARDLNLVGFQRVASESCWLSAFDCVDPSG